MSVFTKLFGRSDKGQKQDQLADTNYIETILKHSEDQPVGIADQNVIYAGYAELGGYYFLQTFIVGKLNIKAKKGARLIMVNNDRTLDLKSDMDEFESENMGVFDGYVTRIDFEIEKEAAENIKRSAIKNITLKVKKHTITFTPLEAEGVDEIEVAEENKKDLTN